MYVVFLSINSSRGLPSATHANVIIASSITTANKVVKLRVAKWHLRERRDREIMIAQQRRSVWSQKNFVHRGCAHYLSRGISSVKCAFSHTFIVRFYINKLQMPRVVGWHHMRQKLDFSLGFLSPLLKERSICMNWSWRIFLLHPISFLCSLFLSLSSFFLSALLLQWTFIFTANELLRSPFLLFRPILLARSTILLTSGRLLHHLHLRRETMFSSPVELILSYDRQVRHDFSPEIWGVFYVLIRCES